MTDLPTFLRDAGKPEVADRPRPSTPQRLSVPTEGRSWVIRRGDFYGLITFISTVAFFIGYFAGVVRFFGP
jgi:hypothetical protein